MAFTTATTRIKAIESVARALGTLRTVHAFAHDLRDMVALYQAGTDPVFNAAFNAVFTAQDRAELSTMINQLTSLVITDWETTHAGALGL